MAERETSVLDRLNGYNSGNVKMIIKAHILALIALLQSGEVPLPAGSGEQQHHECPETHATIGSPRSRPENSLHYESVAIHTDRDVYIAGERLYYRLDIFSSDDDRASSLAYVVLRNSENIPVLTLSADVNGKTGHGSIYLPDTLASGPYQLVAFTNRMRNRPDEFYATKQFLIANRFDDGPDLQAPLVQVAGRQNAVAGVSASIPGSPGTGLADRESARVRIEIPVREFGTRERINIALNAGLPRDSILSVSVSVSRKESLFHSYPDEFFFRKPAPVSPGADRYFFRETQGPIISGRVADKVSGGPLAGATVLLNAPDTVLNLLYAMSLDDGGFHFLLNPYHEGKDLYLSLYGDDKIDGKIEVHDKFALESPFEPAPVKVAEGFDRFLSASRDIVTVNKVFGIDHNLFGEKETTGYPPEVYGKPAVYFDRFDEYVHFTDLQDIARELLHILRIRRQRDGAYRSSLLLEHEEYMVLETPAYFLDGIYVDDLNKILHLDSRILSKMEVQNHNWRHGNIKFTGIVALYSRNNEYRNIVPSSSSISFNQSPIALMPAYHPPVYGDSDSIETAVPDFRQLLFWEPEIKFTRAVTGRTIEFYSGDIKGEFVVRLRGVAQDGTIISEQAEITIK